jgi:glycine betaine/proline transport system substrate-binding protein
MAAAAAAVYLGYTQWAAASAERRAGATSPAHAPRPAGTTPRPDGTERPIRIGWTAWADAEVVTHLVKRILEDRMDQEVELVMADIGIQYQGVASGDLDMMLMAWLPVTHQTYWQRMSGAVVNLGPIYTRARLGWAVPADVPEHALGSIRDLRDANVRRRLGGRIQGIDPGSGLMQASEEVLAHYQLDGYELVSSSGAAMTAALGRAIRRDRWIVVTAWNPHWMFARWDLRYLDDPDGVLGAAERVHALVREGFYQEHPPEITEMLTRIFIPLPELEGALLRATRESVEAAVDWYVEEHPERIEYWVTGELPP